MNSGQNNGNQGNTHKTNGKKLGIEFLSSTKQHSAAHSAALSSTQQCSICNQFQGFLTFGRVRGEKGENEAKKKRKIHQRIGKNNVGKHTKQMEKGLGLYF